MLMLRLWVSCSQTFMADLPQIITSAPVWSVQWTPAIKCWFCKQKMSQPALSWGCKLFPKQALCSVACARSYIFNAPHVCDAERSQYLLELTLFAPDDFSQPRQAWWHQPMFSLQDMVEQRVSNVSLLLSPSKDGEWGSAHTQTARAEECTTEFLCWGCFQPIHGAAMVCVVDHDLRIKLSKAKGRFCRMRCVRLWLSHLKMDTGLKNQSLERTLTFLRSFYGNAVDLDDTTLSDWRLMTDFGGPLTSDQLHAVAVNLECLPRWDDQCRTDVIWKTQSVVCAHHRGAQISNQDFVQWAVSDLNERGLSMRQHDIDSGVMPVVSLNNDSWIPASAPPEIREVLKHLSPDDPVSAFYCKNKDHPKAQHYVLFRLNDLPFAKVSRSVASLQKVLNQTTEPTSDEDDF